MNLKKIIRELELILNELKEEQDLEKITPTADVIETPKFSYNVEMGTIHVFGEKSDTGVVRRAKTISLTFLENNLLKYLYFKNCFSDYDSILKQVFNYPPSEETRRIIFTHIHRINKKLRGVMQLKTLRQKGVKLNIL